MDAIGGGTGLCYHMTDRDFGHAITPEPGAFTDEDHELQFVLFICL